MKYLLLCSLLVSGPVAAAPATLTLDLGGGVKMELVHIEPGTFTQGSPASEVGRGPDEVPRTVTISQPYYISKFPVTRAQWERFALEKSYRTEAEQGTSGGFGLEGGKMVQKKDYTWRNPGFVQGPDHPVTMVTWPDAQAFVQWLGPRTGRQATLPTEAQWEYACRAGTTTPWPTGSDTAAADDWAWHKGKSPNGTQPVGKLKANAWGLYDMGGQVWEWCADWYGPWPESAVTDPLQTNDRLSDKPRRVLRGGSFLKDAAAARSAARFRNDPRSRNADNGFRVVVLDRPPPPPPPVKPATPMSTTVPVENPNPSPVRPSPTSAPSSPPAGHPSPPPQNTPRSSGGSGGGMMAAVIGVVAAFIGWRIIKGRSNNSFSSDDTGGGSSPYPISGLPGVQLGRDGFWITGRFPQGTLMHWAWQAGGQETSGQGAYQPGPEGMFIFTGVQPDGARAWTAGAGQEDETQFNRGAAGGLLMNQYENDRREREEEAERRRRRMEEAEERSSRHQESSPSRSYPSAY